MEEGIEFDGIGSYILTTKVALAVAIIRSKPQGMTGKEYATLLCSNYTEICKGRKERYGELEKELLQAKQEILFYKLRSLHAGQSSETPNCISSQELPNQWTPEAENGRKLTKSVETLSSYNIYLKGMLSLKPVEAIKMSKLDEDDLSVLRSTISTCLLNVKACLLTNCLQNVEMVERMNTGLCYLSSIAMTFLPNDKLIAEACVAVIEETLGTLMNCKPGNYEQQKMFISVVVSLSSIPSVTEKACQKLLVLIEGFCSALESNPVVSKCVDPAKYIAMYYIFEVFEKLIPLHASSQDWVQPMKVASSSFLIDKAVKLSGMHPMISYSIWKLIMLMEKASEDSEEPESIWEKTGIAHA